MASIVISHLICSMALLTLIIILPVFYSAIQDNMRVNVIKLELKEITDYISNTLANTYFLANSTACPTANVTKTLVYLPSTVENSFFVIRVEGNSTSASGVTAYLKDRPSVQATAWLASGLKGGNITVESGKGTISAGCYRNSTGVYVLLNHEVPRL